MKFQEDCHLKEVILDHNLVSLDKEPPHTYINRSLAIDGIFVSKDLQCVSAGYCRFHDGIQVKRVNYQCLWVDFCIKDLFRHQMAPIVKAPARCMTL